MLSRHLTITGGFACAVLIAAVSRGQTREPVDSGAPIKLSDADQSAAKTVVAEFAKTWNRHDMKAMHALNTDEVHWINVAGNQWRGNAEVYKGHDAIHRTVFAKTQMSIEAIAVRALAPDVAVAVATMHFSLVIDPAGREIRDLKTRGSFVLLKRNGVWKIGHFQNTTIDPLAEKNDPITWDETGFRPGPPSGM